MRNGPFERLNYYLRSTVEELTRKKHFADINADWFAFMLLPDRWQLCTICFSP